MSSQTSLTCIFLSFYLFIVACDSCENTTEIKGIFAFGGDIIDNGNNNELLNTINVKSNYLPYGIDFPDGPTGRPSNGKNVVDCIAEQLQLPSPGNFPECRANKKPLLGGVNFGSTGSGIQDTTGGLLVGTWSLNGQIDKFVNEIIPDMKKELNCKPKAFLPNYVILIGSGNNDYASYYILKQNLIWSPQIFASMLINNYRDRIQRLYDVGARKFVLLSVYPVGCEPGLVNNKKVQCIVELNQAVDLFYNQLIVFINQLNQTNEMPGAQFTVVNSASIVMDMINNPGPYGFNNVDCACCDLMVGDTCKKAGRACFNRKEYVYFDGLHLTEAANCALATKAFGSNSTAEVYPFNVKTLTQV